MGERLKESDRAALAGVAHSPPHRKAYSYSHQLRTNTGRDHHKRNYNHPRNHSLDEIEILSNHHSSIINSSDEEEFYRYSSRRDGGASDHHVDYRHLGQMTDGLGVGDGGTCDELSQQSPMQEFMGSGGGVGVFKVPNRAAVHPNRPPCLELRPHPLRETQAGYFYLFAHNALCLCMPCM